MILSWYRRCHKYFCESIPPPDWYHPPPEKTVRVVKWIGAMTWFWFLYRFKEDGLVFVGLAHPWDNHGHDSHPESPHGHESKTTH